MTPSDKKILKQALASLPASRRASLESVLVEDADPVSKDQNLPESYYGLEPKGIQAASRDIQASEADDVASDVSVMKDPEMILRHVIRRAREAYVTGCQEGISEAEKILHMSSLALVRHKILSYDERSVLIDTLDKEMRAYGDKKSKL